MRDAGDESHDVTPKELPLRQAATGSGRLLMLSTIHASHARPSGYARLAEYVPGAEFFHAPFAEPPGGARRWLARVARAFAFSRWYLGGCAALEWQALRRLRRGFRGVVHSMWTDHDLGYLDFFLRAPAQRLCGTFHNCPEMLPLMLRYPSRLQKFAAIVLMSECQRPFFLEAGVADERIHVVLHGVDVEFFVPAPVPPPGFSVLSAGSFRRNFPLLREVCERLPDVAFEVVASREIAPLFAGLPNVRFSHDLSDDALLAKYQAASCLLHTVEAATANNVLVEAMACGLPIVSERIGGIAEYVTPHCARLVAPRDDAALAETVRALAGNAQQRLAMGAASRRRAEELSWPRVAERMQVVYDACQSFPVA